ncbi:hypothetical protein B9Z19DRAFT_1064252 [Tuber borchii]|uniref:Uncharacterized protein n=1 Tax=Tuber borchii TaxID=42251 RepID=A0A2T6ZVB7_TUBBO|nr:hypothetical protein B9Z19DRAFT_1064252 [Tuber borchii]
MAFRSPATTRRHLTLQSIPTHDDDQRRLDSPSLLGSPAISHAPTIEADPDEWVVFSPSSVGGTTAAVTGTHALSQASDLLSVGSARSPRVIRRGFSGSFTDLEDEVEFEEEEEEEEEESCDTETDSLQPFRDLGNEGPVMLPMHDGLGTFPSSSGVISGLKSFEESLRIVAKAAGKGTSDDINARIQKWREEQQKALLDEIQSASRRRTSLFSGSIRGGELKDEDEASMNIEGLETEVKEVEKRTSTSTPTQSNSGASTAPTHGDTHEETLWRRITRRFIRDIMGIDDDLLQVLFGEALPEEATVSFLAEGGRLGSEAEERLLNRIARELGVMVNQYTPHPASDGRAFSTIAGKVKSQDGLSDDNDDGVKTPQPPPPAQQYQQEEPTSIPQLRPRSQSTASTSSIPHYQFAPTLPPLQQSPHHPTLWNIEELLQEEKAAKAEAAKRKEYWEQELGVQVFFSFLKSRFYSSSSPSAPASTASTESAAGIMHPLIPRARVVYPRRRPVGGGAGGGLRSGNTCASQSGTKAKTGKRSRNGGVGGGAGSSRSRGRFYWDVSSSVGSGTSSCVGTGVWGPI